MYIVACSNYFDLNKRVALITGSGKKDYFFANFHTKFRVICPFHLHKIFQCWINQENLSPVLELIMKKAFKPINSILYRCTGLLLIGKKGMLYAQLKFTRVFTLLHLTLVDKLSDHFNEE